MPSTFTPKFRISKPEVGMLDWYLDYWDAMDIIDAHVPRVYMSAPRILSRSKSAGGVLTENKYYFYKVAGVNGTLITVGSWEDIWAQADAINKTITTNWSAVAGATAYRLYRAETTDPSYILADSNYFYLAEIISGTSYTDDGSVVPGSPMPIVPTWYTIEIDQRMIIGDISEAQTQHATPIDIQQNLNNVRHMINQLNGQTNWDDTVVSSMKTMKDRVDVVCETNGDLKFQVKEKGSLEEINTQSIDFAHGLAVVSLGGKAVHVGIDEDELDFDFVRMSALASDADAEPGKFKYYSKTVGGVVELFCIDSAGSIQQLTSKGHFIGGMDKEVRMYWGLVSQIPIKWQLCDGTNSKPNLIDKFIKATLTAITNPGATGGTHTITLTTSNLPSHLHGITITSGTQSANHTHDGTTGYVSGSGGTWYHAHGMSIDAVGDHTHTAPFYSGQRASGGTGGTALYGSATATSAAGAHSHSASISSTDLQHTHPFTTGTVSANHTHVVSGNTGSTGSGASYDNRPAFYELCFITKI